MTRCWSPGGRDGNGLRLYAAGVGDFTIWHNPRCSKSRAARAILDEADVTFDERRYLYTPPTPAELEAVLDALGAEPWEITRLGEEAAKTLGLRTLPHDRAAWIAVLVAHPILIERPIVVSRDGRAVLARPPEVVRNLL